MTLSAADYQEILYALYRVRERIDQYVHPTYEMHLEAKAPVERLIKRVRCARDERKVQEAQR